MGFPAATVGPGRTVDADTGRESPAECATVDWKGDLTMVQHLHLNVNKGHWYAVMLTGILLLACTGASAGEDSPARNE